MRVRLKFTQSWDCLKDSVDAQPTVSQVSDPCVRSSQPKCKSHWSRRGGPWGKAGELHHRNILETESLHCTAQTEDLLSLTPGLKTTTPT